MLEQVLAKIDEYVSGLIDVADMPAEDKEALKLHLLAAQDILVRNGLGELNDFVSGVTAAILSRF